MNSIRLVNIGLINKNAMSQAHPRRTCRPHRSLPASSDASARESHPKSFLPPCDLVIGARRLQVHDLVRLVSGLEAYFITFICEDCWVNLQRQIDLADSVMALRAAHEQYISAVCRHCLLDSEVRTTSRSPDYYWPASRILPTRDMIDPRNLQSQ